MGKFWLVFTGYMNVQEIKDLRRTMNSHSQSMGVQGTLRWGCLVLALLLGWSLQAAAATPPGAQRQADHIIQQEQLRQDQILKDQELRRRPPVLICI